MVKMLNFNKIKNAVLQKSGIIFCSDYDEMIQKQINDIEVFGLKNLSVGDALYFAIKDHSRIDIKQLINEMGMTNNIGLEVKTKGDGKVWVIAEKDNMRKDHLKWLYKIVSVLDNYTLIEYRNKKKNLQTKRYPNIIICLYKWNKEFKSVEHLGLLRRLRLIICLYRHFIEFLNVTCLHCEARKVTTCAFLCDAHCTSSLLTQYFNNIGNIKTITFFHGMSNERIYFSTKSQYLLLYGKFMYDKACGFNIEAKSKYLLCGDPRFIDVDLPKQIQVKNTRTWGIVFDCGFFGNQSNSKILSIVSSLAKKKDYKVFAKFHPTDNGIEIPKEVNDLIDKCFFTQVGITEFMDMVDVGFFINSSAYGEFVMNLMPSFRLRNDNDNYSTISWCTFSKEEELQELINSYENNRKEYENELLETRNTLSVNNIGKRYKEILES